MSSSNLNLAKYIKKYISGSDFIFVFPLPRQLGGLTLQRNTPITKTTLSPLQSGYRSSNALNANLEAIEAAIENTLSRDGTSPNQMEAVLDMNDYRIINLPEPVDGSDAARLTDVLAVAPGTGINTWLVTPSSANLAAAVTDETGTGALVFNTSPTLITPALGTPSSIILTNATGLPVAGITSSTTNPLGVGSLELGHATDTTLARSSAGNMTIEGNLVYRAGGTDVPVADGGTGASTAADARASLSAETIQTFDTRALAAAATIDASVTRIRVNSYSTSCPVCPAVYKEVTDTGTLEAWQFRSNGATRRWQLAETEPVDVMLGVVADGTTDDATATNTFLGYVSTLGGTGIMFPGARKFGSQVTLARNVANNLEIKGYGVSIKTTQGQAISAFKINGSYLPFSTTIRGLTVADTNTTAVAGFEQTATGYVSWPDCDCATNGDSTSATYHPWFLHQATAADPDTGCFWTDFAGARVRRDGTTLLPRAVTLRGACNATRFAGFSCGGVVDGIVMEYEPGYTYLSNGVSVEGAWIEGITGKAVRVIGGAGNQMGGGLVVGGNRLEDINIVLSLEGCTVSAYSYPVFYQYGDIAASVTTLINNPNNLDIIVDIADAVATQRNISINNLGFDFRATTAAEDVVRIRSANIGSGLAFTNGAATGVYETQRYVASGVFEIAADYNNSVNLMLSSIGGLSAKNQRSANFAGVKILTGATTTVTLGYAEANASYAVFATVLGTPHAVGYDNTTTTTFDLIGTSGDIVVWMLLRP